MRCSTCGGPGVIHLPGEEPRECTTCWGAGVVSGTPPLVEFLRARVEEDEALLNDLERAPNRCEWGALRKVQPNLAAYTAQFSGPRMLVECRTKRQVIDLCVSQWDAGGGYDEEAVLARQVVALLALPYADHPDYDESWRP